MTIEVTTAIAPEYWACMFINGDTSGMHDHDIVRAEKWSESLTPWRVVSIGERVGFMRWHDAALYCPFSANCVEYILHKTVETLV